MKFIKSLIVLILLITISFETKTRSKSKLKMKKFNSVLSSKYLSSIWKTPGSGKAKEDESKLLQHSLPGKFSSDFANVKVEDWLKVSSPEFKNESKFPVFFYPSNGVSEALVTVGDYTRINENYRERPIDLAGDAVFHRDPDSPPKRTLFWFRLSDSYFYFSESKKCINVLNSFRYIDKTLEAKKINNLCFELIHKDGSNYKYCALTQEVMVKFLCYIQIRLKLDVDSICHKPDQRKTTVKPGKLLQRVVTQPYILIPMAREQCNENWHYRNHGSDWECLCKEGN